MQDFRTTPKVELHRHLDGSVRFQTITDLMHQYDLDLGTRDLQALRAQATVTEAMDDLTTVLKSFWTTQQVLCSYEAIERVAYENVEDAYNDGIKLIELRFAPAFINYQKPPSNHDIFRGVIDGVRRGMKDFDVQVGLIVILARSFGVEANSLATGDMLDIISNNEEGSELLVGFDLADNEGGIDPQPYVPMVRKARDAGLGVTIHSGEDTDADAVIRTIRLFEPDRIGHGVKIHGSDAAIGVVKERDIILEVSPTSNYLTQTVPTLEAHPLPDLYKSGVKVCINSDDPNLMELDLTHEYEVCHEYYGFTDADFAEMNQWALEKSFLPEEAKARLRPVFAGSEPRRG